MEPHVCPKCDGEKTIDAGTFYVEVKPCPACNGTGIVWEPEPVPITRWPPYDVPGITAGSGSGPER
ncbi:hypothetical protein ES703_95843 [subsurface metagenome]